MPKPHGEHGLQHLDHIFVDRFFTLRIRGFMLAPTIRLISTLLQREAAGFRWSHTEDTKMSPKFVFFLQTRDAENAAPAFSLDTPTVAICFRMAKIVAVTMNGVVTVFQQGVRCASLTFLAPLLPRSQGPCILALRASDHHCHLEECFQTSVSREPRHRLIHRQSRRSLSRPANRSNVSIARDQEQRTSECTCKGLNNRLDVKTMADNVNDARKSLRGFFPDMFLNLY